MGNYENIEPHGFDKRSANEARESGKKGGVNSGKAQRRKKNMAECAKLLSGLNLPKDKARTLRGFGIDEGDATFAMGVVAAMFREVLNGDVNAAKFVREILGEDPRVKLAEKELKRKEREMQQKADAEKMTGTFADFIIEAYSDEQGGAES